jgi:hypothetical protein
MDCKNARLLLEFLHPGSAELDRDDAAALHQHLAECPDCAAQAREERRGDEHLGRAVRAVPVPDGLRERLLKRLTDDRDARYRRWLVRGVAVAAALAALWVGGLVWFNRLPAVTSETVRRIADRRRTLSRDEVIQRFKQEFGVNVNAPDQFKYDLLDSYGLKILEGRPVPYLLFFSRGDRGDPRAPPPALAHVYVLSGHQFDLDETMRNIGAPSPGIHFNISVDFSHDRDAIYLILYTGNDLKPFQFESKL